MRGAPTSSGARATSRRSGARSSRSCSQSAEEAQPRRERLAGGPDLCGACDGARLKDTDIDLGLVAKTGIVDRAVADAAFALKEGEVSQPVQGRFGTAIVQVTKIEPEQVRTLRGGRAPSSRARSPPNAPRTRSRPSTTRSRTSGRAARSCGRSPRSSASTRTRSRRSTARAATRTARRVSLPGGVDILANCLRLRRRRRQRSAAAAGRRLCLVRGRRTSPRRASATSTRSRTGSKRAGATIRSPNACSAKATEIARTSSRPARRSPISPPPRASRSRPRPASSAASRRGALDERARGRVPHRQGRGRRGAEGHKRDRADRLPCHRRQHRRSSTRLGGRQAHRRRSSSASPPDDVIGQYLLRLQNDIGVTHQSRLRCAR